MIQHNALIIDGLSTASFPYKILVEDRPSFHIPTSKSQLQEHDGLSGGLVLTNKHRKVIEKAYRIHLIAATEEQINEFSALLTREGFWLESERMKTTRYWCYKVDSFDIVQDNLGVFTLEVTFLCHPTRYFKEVSEYTLTKNGTIPLLGSALSYPKITVSGKSTGETSFTIGEQVIGLEQLNKTLVMDNDPHHPSFLTESGELVYWSGDFITLDANQKDKKVGVVLGTGITSLHIEILWGWA